MSSFYSSKEFEDKYTYRGTDLGAVWTEKYTDFRAWSPTADHLSIRLYGSGNKNDFLEEIPMTRDVQGTWICRKDGNLNGIYYTILVKHGNTAAEVCDPYAVTAGLNGQRAMVLDLRSTDPEGWSEDRNPHAGESITDAVIYELHIRDMSSDSSSGIRAKGKYPGLTETGTVNDYGEPTGIDYIRRLGITHLHLLPFYDFGSVDEADESAQFNWGYDPVNYNVPEGSYSTDPYHGEVRVRELKQMICSLHRMGISVIMDVVYNHVFDAERFSVNQLVPGYFSRASEQGNMSDGSCCGNDTASERSMVQKFIVDSVAYWAEEYHIDGFRFDLVGILDVDTINVAMQRVHETRPDVIFYGEGWKMNTVPTREVKLCTQEHADLVPGFAFFNDTIRDLLKGSVFDSRSLGYVTGAALQKNTLQKCVCGLPDWSLSPAQTVNYVSCHDNLTLYDQITEAVPEKTPAERIRMNCMAAAISILSEGIPFIHAGEEILRTKPLPGGGFSHNSYCSPDSVNSIKWNSLHEKECQRVFAYYRGLIAFRKANPLLHMTDGAECRKRIRMIDGFSRNAAGFILDGSDLPEKTVLAAFLNPSETEITAELPAGKWDICIEDETAGVTPLRRVSGKIAVSPLSVTVLTKNK